MIETEQLKPVLQYFQEVPGGKFPGLRRDGFD